MFFSFFIDLDLLRALAVVVRVRTIRPFFVLHLVTLLKLLVFPSSLIDEFSVFVLYR
jgi:hypothetical protein